jgi:hypothetical protein
MTKYTEFSEHFKNLDQMEADWLKQGIELLKQEGPFYPFDWQFNDDRTELWLRSIPDGDGDVSALTELVTDFYRAWRPLARI